jgi:type IV secretory pathway VirJ component
VQTREEGRLGAVRVFTSARSGAGFVFVFSDAAGWSPDLAAAARRLAAEGALVVGVDLPGYLRGLRASDDGCHYVVAELEDLSHRLQREYGFPSYRSPILSGVGEGGTLAYAALAQSPAATVAGAIGVDPAPSLDTRVPLCEGAPASPAPGGGYRYGQRSELPGFWRVSAPGAAPGSAGGSAATPAPSGSPATRLAALAEEALAVRAPAQMGLADLPLVELPVPGAATQLAVIYSGDGGWRDLDKQIAGVLVREGTPVVGVDSLRYFWSAKTPERVASDLARILRHYEAAWRVNRVLLIGYSFGAGILPFAVNGLPADLRDGVVQISLLGLEPQAPFQISVTGWLGAEDAGLPVLPQLARLDPGRVQCFYGEEEEDTACTAAELAGSERIRTSGGHHFDGDYEKLARLILAGAARRSGVPAQPASG